nr:reverse transcriptase domain-containing protein [Tanacetum cinerariifolium]
MIFHINSAMKHSYSNDDTCFSIDVIDKILKEDFDALLDEDSEILHFIEGTILEEKLFAEFDEFLAMTTDENFESESDIKEPPFKKITINTNYKIKTSIEEPHTDLELKTLPDNLEYVFLEEPYFLHVIISSYLSEENKNKLEINTYVSSTVFGYFRIPVNPMDQEKTTFTCGFGTYAYRRMPFGLCNAPATFQRCMLAIFYDMIEESVEVFMNDFSVFGSSFDHCLINLDKMLQRCKDAHLVLNWEKCHFMVKEGIVLRHKVSEVGLKVKKAKIDVISKLPPPTNIKGMPIYAKFLKEHVNNKHKIEQISTAFLGDESSMILQTKVPPKLGYPESFLILCNFNKAFSCNALANLGASINLMAYSLYAKLSLETLKPTK